MKIVSYHYVIFTSKFSDNRSPGEGSGSGFVFPLSVKKKTYNRVHKAPSVPEPLFNKKIGRPFSIQTAHRLLVSGSRFWINVSKAVTVTQDPVPHMPPTVYLG